jgi:hypothetical protein
MDNTVKKIITNDENNKIIINDENNENDNYWQTQAILVMNNLNITDKNNNIFPVKYSVKGFIVNNNASNKLELMEDLSI